jgi:transcriptional regulator with XRE-family HTH domain
MARKTEMRRLRRNRDLRLADVSDAVGINEPRLSCIERGIARPTAEQREQLERFYGKPWDELSAEAREVA